MALRLSALLIHSSARGACVAAAIAFGLVATAAAPVSAEDAKTTDPRAGDPSYERGAKLFGAIRQILDEAARTRLNQQTDPDGALERFMWKQFGLDSSDRVRDLLGSAFEMMTDAPVVDIQREIAKARGEIEKMRGQIGDLRERRISAPESAGIEGWLGLTEDQHSMSRAIEDLERRIAGQEQKIADAKTRFGEAMAAVGAPMPEEQIDLLLESVTGGDLVELAAAYEAVRGLSQQLRRLMDESGEDLAYARRYYGMHTTLIALLVEAQTGFLDRIDGEYLPKLDAIERDIRMANRESRRLMEDRPTREQQDALLANIKSQRIAREALGLYRRYLERQLEQIAETRARSLKELRIADNTLRTVDASFQLRAVMEERGDQLRGAALA